MTMSENNYGLYENEAAYTCPICEEPSRNISEHIWHLATHEYERVAYQTLRLEQIKPESMSDEQSQAYEDVLEAAHSILALKDVFRGLVEEYGSKVAGYELKYGDFPVDMEERPMCLQAMDDDSFIYGKAAYHLANTEDSDFEIKLDIPDTETDEPTELKFFDPLGIFSEAEYRIQP